MKTHPLITEIQLGRSIKEVALEMCDDMDFQLLGTDEIESCIKELILLNDPKAKFVVFMFHDNCWLSLVNNEWPAYAEFNYWDDGYARDDDAFSDCELLNEVVRRLFATEKKQKKIKIKRSDYVKKKGKVCPYCGKKKTVVVLDDFVTNSTRQNLACSGCGETWTENHKLVLTGYDCY